MSRHQQIDLPPPKRHVKEVQVPVVKCPHCRRNNRPPTPPGFENPAQYGPNTKAAAVDLTTNHAVSVERTQEILGDMLGQAPSQGSIMNWISQAYTLVENAEESIRKALRKGGILHGDESGIRCESSTFWLHTACSQMLTLLGIHKKRGKEGIDSLGVWHDFRGTAIHDCFRTYFRYENASHALCHAHIQRELEGFIEQGNDWAWVLRQRILRAKHWRDRLLGEGRYFNPTTAKQLESSIRNAIKDGLDSLSARQKTIRRNGKRVKQTKAKNFLDRCILHFQPLTAFIHDPSVPFTNNQAERDLRMAKVKLKVAGCFRSENGSRFYARIRSYILTAKKHGFAAGQALRDAFAGHPFLVPDT